MFTPKVCQPTPYPWFVRELRLIDPELRVVWAYERYLMNQWAIERRMTPEQYYTAYSWVLSQDKPRFVDQPIFDTDKPIYDDEGVFIAYEQVATRRYDLAPEWECVAMTKTLDNEVILRLKRAYAWQEKHPISRLRFEKQQEQDAKDEAFHKRVKDASDQALDQAFLETRKKVQFGRGKTRNE
jgi:hypothetical protein